MFEVPRHIWKRRDSENPLVLFCDVFGHTQLFFALSRLPFLFMFMSKVRPGEPNFKRTVSSCDIMIQRKT